MAVHVKTGPTRKDGLQSLFLLTYNKLHDEHKPLRESLKTYVYASPKTLQQKEHNKQKMMFAEKIRMQRETELDAAGGGVNVFLKQGSFIEYFKKLMREKKSVEGSYSTWKSTYNHLLIFLNGQDIKIKDCDDLFLEQFKDYLLKCKSVKSDAAYLANNSANIYLSKVKAALNSAVKKKIITDSPSRIVENIKMNETFREYLTIEELTRLKRSSCKIPLLRKAFIFSCYTGLRWSDLYKLKWGKITYFEHEKTWKIEYRQQKTGHVHHLPIASQAVDLLGVFGEKEERVFEGLGYNAYNNMVLKNWVKEQGISKHITFHCARHTFAVIMLIKTKDVFTVSKLLGHNDLKTTMIYAKIVNATLNEAANSFPDLDV